MTYMFISKCALKLVLKNILYYDARSEKHQDKNCSYTRRVYIYPAVGLSWFIREASELWDDLTGMEKGGVCESV